jgi:F-type H+-transporting ATPase subunit b
LLISGEMTLEINFTLIIQMLVFMAFVWFTMKFVWPPLEKALQDRQDKIADGLAAAERGQREFELAQFRAKDELKQAKAQAADIIEKAHSRASQLVEEAKVDAREEAQKVTRLAQEQLVHEVNQAKTQLRQRVANLAVAGAEKIIRREVDEKTSLALLDNLIEEI